MDQLPQHPHPLRTWKPRVAVASRHRVLGRMRSRTHVLAPRAALFPPHPTAQV